jgi:hypothetical protein
VSLDVESVLAAIDTTAAGDTTALLTVADSSGAVIARKAQTSKVTGGGTGSATWALRLADDPPPAAAADMVLLWEFTVAPFSQALVRTNADGPMAVDPLSQGFKTLEVFTAIHMDTIAAGRTNVLMRFNDDVAAHYFVQTQELAGNPPAFNNSFVQGNGVFYIGAGAVNGNHMCSMTAWLPGYAQTAFNKSGHLIAAGRIDNAAPPTVGVVQTVGFQWDTVTAGNPSPPIRRIRWETNGPAGITEFALGSYFAVYGRR